MIITVSKPAGTIKIWSFLTGLDNLVVTATHSNQEFDFIDFYSESMMILGV